MLSTCRESRSARVIDLVAVDRRFQRRGVAKALIRGLFDQCHDHADEIRVGTQIANAPSLRLYENCGFRVCSSVFVLHRHTQYERATR